MTIPTLEPSAVSDGMIECEYSVGAKYAARCKMCDEGLPKHYYGPLTLFAANQLASWLIFCNFDEVTVQAAMPDAIKCNHDTRYFSKICAAKICRECDDHEGLDRCWCGWSRTGGNGNTELSEMGENIEAEDY